ncbi:GIY-YIG nuclease family protein [Metabacillus sp. cB07]|uniref:GIY-YIG nuclease family protein n=1 Tax=Metabacillus sp. cB07 TaxID=2806989 RepID=UPI00193A5B86|nr:GIY-YIG nuclease family protein [Metabacillus sp. cB07]
MPRIIEELILTLFNGKLIKRDEIVTKVLKFHLDQGGRTPDAVDFPRSVKKALTNLAKKELAKNVSHGFWEIGGYQKEIDDVSLVEEMNVLEKEYLLQERKEYQEFGEGNSTIYLYYFESYRELANLKGELSWPCKIGLSERDPKLRVLSQAATALPEIPNIEFILKTDQPHLLELIIHSILKIRGKHIEHSPGKEWFNTNPSEILEIVKFINGEHSV